MIKELLYKFFGIEPFSCPTCEVLKNELEVIRQERNDLLNRLLDKPKEEEIPPANPIELTPITPHHIPWRVRQQMLEEESVAKALKEQKDKEVRDSVAKLEKELDIHPEENPDAQ
jgi:hypothetical protein